MDNMEKEFRKVIDFLRALGYSRDQINYGIIKLDEDKYDSDWNTNLVIADINNNIEQGENK